MQSPSAGVFKIFRARESACEWRSAVEWAVAGICADDLDPLPSCRRDNGTESRPGTFTGWKPVPQIRLETGATDSARDVHGLEIGASVSARRGQRSPRL